MDVKELKKYSKELNKHLDGEIGEIDLTLGEEELLEAFVTKLAEVQDRIIVFREATLWVEQGSDLEKEVVAGFVRQVNSLPKAGDRLAAFREVARYGRPDRLLQQQTLAEIKKYTNSERIPSATPGQEEARRFMERMLKRGKTKTPSTRASESSRPGP